MIHGILLINLGTPRSPTLRDVYRYLSEFLTDEKVIDLPWWKRQLLVRGAIIPKRLRQSTASYKAIWTAQGSPLMVHSKNLKQDLQNALGPSFKVALAMRYQHPSIADAIQELSACTQWTVIPLFPQYAEATTGSILAKLQVELHKAKLQPQIRIIRDFPDNPQMIETFATLAKPYLSQPFDHLLFSFHGLPERQLKKSSQACLTAGCCSKNRDCYASQCRLTAETLRVALNLPPEKVSLSFQSRLGKEPWLQPYTSEVIEKLAHAGKKRVLVMCPAFVADCLETLHEIKAEYGLEFQKAGGETLTLIPSLNSHPAWVHALRTLILEKQSA